MSTDFFAIDDSLYNIQHSTLLNSEETQFVSESDPFSALSDSSVDSFLQEIFEETNTNAKEPNLEQLAQTLISSSPPSHQFETLSLYQQNHLSNLQNSSGFSGGYLNYPVSAIKTEDCYLGGQSYSGRDEMRRRLLESGCYSHDGSSHSYEGEKPWLLFQPRLFDALFASSAFLSTPENGFSSGNGQMRRVYSTGDLPVIKSNQPSAQFESSTATTFMEEANFKVGRYTAEERKERIDRYRAKRTLRNFNKTIKYACRKTLADNRPRVRGRFARNDETGEMPRSANCSSRFEDEDDILLYSWHEEEDVGRAGGGGRSAGGSDGGGGGEGGGQFVNYEFEGSSELRHYFGY